MARSQEPEPAVREAFAGDVFFKRLDMSLEALTWQERVLSSVREDGFRVAPPVRSRHGDLVVAGWTAWKHLEGEHAERWDDIVAVGERFHGALAGRERPSFVARRIDRWAVADRRVWGDVSVPIQTLTRVTPGDDHTYEALLAGAKALAALLRARGAISAPSQVVHGDLSGNVLFADGLPPAIIDVSPFWRPPAYASAIVAVDAALWHGADPALLDAHPGPMLTRALLFRLLVEDGPIAATAAQMVVVRAVLERASA